MATMEELGAQVRKELIRPEDVSDVSFEEYGEGLRKGTIPYDVTDPFYQENPLGFIWANSVGPYATGAINMINNTVTGGIGYGLGAIGRGVEAISPFSGGDKGDSWFTSASKGVLDAQNVFENAINDYRLNIVGTDPTLWQRTVEGSGSTMGFWLTGMGAQALAAAKGLPAAMSWALGALARGGMEALSETGGFMGDAYREGNYDKGALGAASASFVANTVLNSVLNYSLGNFSKAVENELNPTKRWIKGGLTEVLNEILQEPSQHIIEQAAKKSLDPKSAGFLSELGTGFKNDWLNTFKEVAPEVTLSTLLTQGLLGAAGLSTRAGRRNFRTQTLSSQLGGFYGKKDIEITDKQGNVIKDKNGNPKTKRVDWWHLTDQHLDLRDDSNSETLKKRAKVVELYNLIAEERNELQEQLNNSDKNGTDDKTRENLKAQIEWNDAQLADLLHNAKLGSNEDSVEQLIRQSKNYETQLDAINKGNFPIYESDTNNDEIKSLITERDDLDDQIYDINNILNNNSLNNDDIIETGNADLDNLIRESRELQKQINSIHTSTGADLDVDFGETGQLQELQARKEIIDSEISNILSELQSRKSDIDSQISNLYAQELQAKKSEIDSKLSNFFNGEDFNSYTYGIFPQGNEQDSQTQTERQIQSDEEISMFADENENIDLDEVDKANNSANEQKIISQYNALLQEINEFENEFTDEQINSDENLRRQHDSMYSRLANFEQQIQAMRVQQAGARVMREFENARQYEDNNVNTTPLLANNINAFLNDNPSGEEVNAVAQTLQQERNILQSQLNNSHVDMSGEADTDMETLSNIQAIQARIMAIDEALGQLRNYTPKQQAQTSKVNNLIAQRDEVGRQIKEFIANHSEEEIQASPELQAQYHDLYVQLIGLNEAIRNPQAQTQTQDTTQNTQENESAFDSLGRRLEKIKLLARGQTQDTAQTQGSESMTPMGETQESNNNVDNIQETGDISGQKRLVQTQIYTEQKSLADAKKNGNQSLTEKATKKLITLGKKLKKLIGSAANPFSSDKSSAVTVDENGNLNIYSYSGKKGMLYTQLNITRTLLSIARASNDETAISEHSARHAELVRQLQEVLDSENNTPRALRNMQYANEKSAHEAEHGPGTFMSIDEFNKLHPLSDYKKSESKTRETQRNNTQEQESDIRVNEEADTEKLLVDDEPDSKLDEISNDEINEEIEALENIEGLEDTNDFDNYDENDMSPANLAKIVERLRKNHEENETESERYNQSSASGAGNETDLFLGRFNFGTKSKIYGLNVIAKTEISDTRTDRMRGRAIEIRNHNGEVIAVYYPYTDYFEFRYTGVEHSQAWKNSFEAQFRQQLGDFSYKGGFTDSNGRLVSDGNEDLRKRWSKRNETDNDAFLSEKAEPEDYERPKRIGSMQITHNGNTKKLSLLTNEVKGKLRRLFGRVISIVDENNRVLAKFTPYLNKLQFSSNVDDEIKFQIDRQMRKHASEYLKAGNFLDEKGKLKPDGNEEYRRLYYERKNNKGKTVNIRTIQGTEIQAKYKIMEIDDLITSTLENGAPNPEYSQELQPRDRSREASQQQIATMAANIDPELLAENRLVSDGAPVIGSDRMVESGNGRTMALRRAYNTNSAENYKTWLRDNAERFGYNPEDVDNFKRPILVRERTSDVDRVKFTAEANDSSIARMSTTESAMNDAKRITDSMLSLYESNKKLSENRNFINAFLQAVPVSERGEFTQKDGRISKAGLLRIENALIAKAYNDTSIVNRLSESTSEVIKNVVNALNSAAPDIGLFENSDINPELSIRRDIMQAVNIFNRLQSTGISVDEELSQTEFKFDNVEQTTSTAKKLLKMFDKYKRSAKRIAQVLSYYATEASKEAKASQTLLPGMENSRRTKDEILSHVLDEMEKLDNADKSEKQNQASKEKNIVDKAVDKVKSKYQSAREAISNRVEAVSRKIDLFTLPIRDIFDSTENVKEIKRLRRKVYKKLLSFNHPALNREISKYLAHLIARVSTRFARYAGLSPEEYLASRGLELEYNPKNDAENRGGIEYKFQPKDDNGNIIREANNFIKIFQNSDASTIIHEAGHFFLNDYRDLMRTGKITGVALQDWKTLIKWLDVEDLDLTQSYHKDSIEGKRWEAAQEKFAVGFEKYAREGVAPTKKLRRAFEAFKRWLYTIYNTFEDMVAVSGGYGYVFRINDDVRRVFNNMFTDLDAKAKSFETEQNFDSSESERYNQPLNSDVVLDDEVNVVKISATMPKVSAWERMEKFDKSRYSEIIDKFKNGRVVNEHTGLTITLTKKGLSHILHTARNSDNVGGEIIYQATPYLDELARNAYRVETHQDRKPSATTIAGQQGTLKQIHRFLVPIELDGQQHVLKLTAKEYETGKVEVDEVQLYDMNYTKKLSARPSQDSSNLMERAAGTLADTDTVSVRDLLRDVNDVDGNPYYTAQYNQSAHKNSFLTPDTLERYNQMATHATGHILRGNKFDLQYVGTGEGGAAFGYGIYLEQNPDVAEKYRKMGLDEAEYPTKRGNVYKVEIPDNEYLLNWDKSLDEQSEEIQGAINEALDMLNYRREEGLALRFAEYLKRDSYVSHLEDWIKDFQQRYNKNEEDAVFEYEGETYDYDNDAFDGVYDELIQEEFIPRVERFFANQNEEIFNELVEAVKDHVFYFNDYDRRLEYSGEVLQASATAEEFYWDLAKLLGSDKNASMYLNSLGIPGHYYWDKLSRDKKSGTSNFVIWNTDLLEVLGLTEDSDDDAKEYFARMKEKLKGTSPKDIDLDNLDDSDIVSEKDIEKYNQIAFHGTRHTILGNKFDLEKIGIGEGAQVYGYGIYFGGAYETAEYYRTAGMLLPDVIIHTKDGRKLIVNPKNFPTTFGQVRDVLTNANKKYAGLSLQEKKKALIAIFTDGIQEFQQRSDDYYDSWAGRGSDKEIEESYPYMSMQKIIKNYQSAIDNINSIESFEIEQSSNGNIYVADIPENDVLLNWDETLDNQPKHVKKAVNKIKATLNRMGLDMTEVNNAKTGEDLYCTITKLMKDYIRRNAPDDKTARASKLASLIFNKFGVPGHRFFDSGSRAAKSGTHNYVIWDVDAVKLLGLTEDSNDDAKEYFRKTKEAQERAAREKLKNFNPKKLDLDNISDSGLVDNNDVERFNQRAYLATTRVLPDNEFKLGKMGIDENPYFFGYGALLENHMDNIANDVEVILDEDAEITLKKLGDPSGWRTVKKAYDAQILRYLLSVNANDNNALEHLKNLKAQLPNAKDVTDEAKSQYKEFESLFRAGLISEEDYQNERGFSSELDDKFWHIYLKAGFFEPDKLNAFYVDAIQEIRGLDRAKQNTYEFNTPPHSVLLKWNSNIQPKHVRQGINKIKASLKSNPKLKGFDLSEVSKAKTGEELYWAIQNVLYKYYKSQEKYSKTDDGEVWLLAKKNTSSLFNQAGIPGHVMTDESTIIGHKVRNTYIIWDKEFLKATAITEHSTPFAQEYFKGVQAEQKRATHENNNNSESYNQAARRKSDNPENLRQRTENIEQLKSRLKNASPKNLPIDDFTNLASEQDIERFNQRAYHSTGHKMLGNRFDFSKMSTGIGMQVSGYGAYLILDMDATRDYRQYGLDLEKFKITTNDGQVVTANNNQIAAKLVNRLVNDLNYYSETGDKALSFIKDTGRSLKKEIKANAKMLGTLEKAIKAGANERGFIVVNYDLGAYDHSTEVYTPDQAEESLKSMRESLKEDRELLKFIESIESVDGGENLIGNTYIFDAPENDVLLNWNENLENQPVHVKKAVNKLIAGLKRHRQLQGFDLSKLNVEEQKGGELYHIVSSLMYDYYETQEESRKFSKEKLWLAAQKAASNFFNYFGIPGLRREMTFDEDIGPKTELVIWDKNFLEAIDITEDSNQEAKEYFRKTKAEQENNSEHYNQIVGESAARRLDKSEGITTRMDNLKIAQQMERQALSDEKIWAATGWQRGTEGKWRYEIPDGKIISDEFNKIRELNGELIDLEKIVQQYPNEPDYGLTPKQKQRHDELEKFAWSVKLSDIFDAPDLYNSYPEIRNISVAFDDSQGNYTAMYDPNSNMIWINVDFYDNAPSSEQREVLIHEIQHYIQDREGFAAGGSPEMFKTDKNDKVLVNPFMRQNYERRAKMIFDNLSLGLRLKFKHLSKQEAKFGSDRAEEFNKLLHSKLNEDEIQKYNEWQNAKQALEIIDNYPYRYSRRNAYTNLAGEVEARNAETRSNWNEEQRRATPLSKSEDIDDRINQFVVDEKGKAYSQSFLTPEKLELYNQRMYHGTGHIILNNGFSFEKISTGEGAAMFGYGAYFTQNLNVAETYRKMGLKPDEYRDKVNFTTSDKQYSDKEIEHDRILSSVEDDFIEYLKYKNPSAAFNEIATYLRNQYLSELDEAKESLEKTTQEAKNYTQKTAVRDLFAPNPEMAQERINDIQRKIDFLDSITDFKYVPRKRGNIYEFEIPENEDLLSWDNTLSKQSKKIKPSIQKALKLINKNSREISSKNTGEDLYRALVNLLGSDENASMYLNSLGIPGHYYLDGLSRTGKIDNQTYNAVIWNEDKLKMLAISDNSDEDAKEYFRKTKAEQENSGNSESYNQIASIRAARKLDTDENTTWRIDNLRIARAMKRAGLSDSKMWLATGWQTGKDGKWRFEIPDMGKNTSTLAQEYIHGKDVMTLFDKIQESTNRRNEFRTIIDELEKVIPARLSGKYSKEEKAKFRKMRRERNTALRKYKKEVKILDDLDVKIRKAIFKAQHFQTTLGEFWDTDNPVFQAYPELKDTKIIGEVFNKDDKNKGSLGYYSPAENTIHLNTDMYFSDRAHFSTILFHEVQHAIQEIEGFGEGGNVGYYERELTAHNDMLQFYDDYISDLNKQLGIKNMSEKEIQDFLNAKYKEDPHTVRKYRSILKARNDEEARWNKKYNGVATYSGRGMYDANSGEVEARNTQTRYSMSEEKRRKTALHETEDISRASQFVEYYNQAARNTESLSISQEQLDEVRKKYERTNQWLKAPNGKKSNLNEQQWLQVRTDNFKRWFGDWENDAEHASQIVDENGEPRVVYHGTPYGGFEEFDMTGEGYSANTGAWFTSSRENAVSYASYGDENLYPVFLNIRNPFIIEGNKRGWNELGEVWIEDLETGEIYYNDDKGEPFTTVNDTEDYVFRKIDDGTFEANTEERPYREDPDTGKGLIYGRYSVAMDSEYSHTNDIVRGVFDGELTAEDVDGVIFKDIYDNARSSRILSDIFVTRTKENIKSATKNINFNPNDSNIYHQDAKFNNRQTLIDTPQEQLDEIRRKYEGTNQWLKAPNGKNTNLTENQWLQVRTPNFKRWFGDWENDSVNTSKVLDENGEPLVMYHGTGRADRVGSVFSPKRATSGPMAFFTSSEKMALTYSKSKKDTSLSREGLENYRNWFNIPVKGRGGKTQYVNISDYWDYLSYEERQKIAELAPAITRNDESEIELRPDNKKGLGGYEQHIRKARGNHLDALVQEWLDSGNLFNSEERFLEVLKLAGIDNVKYIDPNYREEAVYSVFLNIKKPFITTEISNELLAKLRKAAARAQRNFDDRNAYYYSDSWDKTGISPADWISELEDDIKNNTTFSWTRIPDWVTNTLKREGYDGIKDLGGKYNREKHIVYIPFASTQVKSATGNTGEFNPKKPDIYHQSATKYTVHNDKYDKYHITIANSNGTETTYRLPIEQFANIYGKYYKTDKWLKAPNGKKSNLDEIRWVQVRTPAFKAWFGDWENDSQHSSKMLDENGEPRIFYRGSSRKDVKNFHANEARRAYGTGSWFTSNYDVARQYILKDFGAVYPVFLNIRNPLEFPASKREWNHLETYYIQDKDKKQTPIFADKNGNPFLTRKAAKEYLADTLGDSKLEKHIIDVTYYSTDDIVYAAFDGEYGKKKYDGVVFHDIDDNVTYGTKYISDVVVVPDNSQIKSKNNTGYYDPKGDIYHQAMRNNPLIKTYVFEDPDTEREYKESRKGEKPKTLIDQQKHAIKELMQKLSGDFPELATSEAKAHGLTYAREILRRMNRNSAAAIQTSTSSISASLSKLTPEQFDIFGRFMLLHDIKQFAEKNPNAALPLGFTQKTLAAEYNKFFKLAQQDEVIKDAVMSEYKEHARIKKELSTLAKELGMKKFASKLQHYETYMLNIARMLKGEDINANYIQLVGDFRRRLLQDIERLNAIKEIRDLYDKKRELVQQYGEKDWRKHVPAGYKVYNPLQGEFITSDKTLTEIAVGIVMENTGTSMGLSEETKKFLRMKVSDNSGSHLLVLRKELADTLDKLAIPVVDKRGIFSRTIKPFTTGWKKYTLYFPTRTIKYNFRNLTGDLDIVIAGNPSALKKLPHAISELWNFYYGDKSKASKELLEFQKRGGAITIETTQELYNYHEMREFRHLVSELENQDASAWKKLTHEAWQLLDKFLGSGIVKFTDFREQWLRYATYLDYLEQMQKNDDRMPNNFGASVRDEVMSIPDIRDRAFKLSNELIGAYDQVSEAGRIAREVFIPFYSWLEVNAKRYVQLFKNGLSDNPHEFVGNFLKGQLFNVPYYGYKLGKTYFMIQLLSALISAFNHLVFPDDEDKLPPDIQERPHLVLGHDSQGRVLYFDRVGSLLDFMEWFGQDNSTFFPFYKDVKDILNGEQTFTDFARKVGSSAWSKFFGSWTPVIKWPIEIGAGLTFFPSATRPRHVNDIPKYIAQAAGLSWPYKAITGESRSDSNELKNLFVYSADADQAAYFYTLSKVREFQEKVLGRRFDGYATTQRTEALRKIRSALRYNDQKALESAINEYASIEGSSARGLRTSLRNMHPLHGLSRRDVGRFLDWLGPEDEKYYERAEKYYETLMDRF